MRRSAWVSILLFLLVPCAAALEKARLLIFSGAPSGYGYTGTLSVHATDSTGAPLDPPLQSQPFLPSSGSVTTAIGVSVPSQFTLLYTVPPAGTGPAAFATDHPAQGPTACGLCFPATRVSGSFLFNSMQHLNDGACDVEFAWDLIGDLFPVRFLTMKTAGAGAGTISPSSGPRVPQSQVTISAVPDSNSIFRTWSGTGVGSYTGALSMATITMQSSITQTASFAPIEDFVVKTDPPGKTIVVDGQTVTTPYSLRAVVPSTHSVAVDSIIDPGGGTRERFTSWNDSIQKVSRTVLFQGTAVTPDFVASYVTEHWLEIVEKAEGTVSPGDGWYADSTGISLQATPVPTWEFSEWIGTGNGSFSGPDNPATVTMLGTLVQEPVFVPDSPTGFEFHVSADSTDPFVQSAPPANSTRNLYLWATCLERGLSALEANVTGSLVPTAFVPTNGVLNAGGPGNLLLAVPGCPTGATVNHLLGFWVVSDTGGDLCLGPSAANGRIVAADCVALPPGFPDPVASGFSSAGAPCVVGTNACQGPVAVELSQLLAVVENRHVLLTWSTAVEIDHDGFHVYRREVDSGTETRMTKGILRGRSPYSWTDDTVEGDRTYFYRVGAVSLSGEEVLHGPVRVTTPAWGPRTIQLRFARPNPFTEHTDLGFTLVREANVRLAVFDIAGRRVRLVAQGPRAAGDHQVRWDGRDEDGRVVPAGIYFVRLSAPEGNRTQKVIRLGIR